jgi:diaminopimelate epimerase
MPLEFHKMHGAGNDFVLIDARGSDYQLEAGAAARIADRHTGIGCDQVLILREPGSPDNDAAYEIRNADGSRAAQCGNGARCIALYLRMQDHPNASTLRVESPSGPVTLQACDDGEFEVGMGVPRFSPAAVPLNLEARNGWYRLDSPWGLLEFGAASMGNPHALLLTENIRAPEIPELGAYLGRHEAFPEGCNVGFAQLDGSDRIRLRVIERGVGETLACGSGACAAMAILHRARRVGDAVDVVLPGGRLVIKWRGNNRALTMKGPAVHVFRGTMDE